MVPKAIAAMCSLNSAGQCQIAPDRLERSFDMEVENDNTVV